MLRRLKKQGNKKGFTLVELIIVIAIIGILAAVLVPTMISVVDKANVSNAAQNLDNSTFQKVKLILTDFNTETGGGTMEEFVNFIKTSKADNTDYSMIDSTVLFVQYTGTSSNFSFTEAQAAKGLKYIFVRCSGTDATATVEEVTYGIQFVKALKDGATGKTSTQVATCGGAKAPVVKCATTVGADEVGFTATLSIA